MLRRLESAFLAFLGSYPRLAGLMKHADTRKLVPLVNSKMIGVVDGRDRGRNGKISDLLHQFKVNVTQDGAQGMSLFIEFTGVKSIFFKKSLLQILFICTFLFICPKGIAQDIIVPKNIREFKFDNSLDEKIRCSYISIYHQERETSEIYTFYVNEPSDIYSSIKDVRLRGTRLSITFNQKIELMQYQSNIIVKDFQIDPNKVEDLEKEQQCVKLLPVRKELNPKKIKPTGVTKWFDQKRKERILIVGFDKPIQISEDDLAWKRMGELEIDLRTHIRVSANAAQVINLSIRCVTCSSKNSELPEGIAPAVTNYEVRVDFRFLKNQMERGLVE
jgi:hypothetical protein